MIVVVCEWISGVWCGYSFYRRLLLSAVVMYTMSLKGGKVRDGRKRKGYLYICILIRTLEASPMDLRAVLVVLGTGDLLSRGVLTCAPGLLRIGSCIGGSHLREDSQAFGPDRQLVFSTLHMHPLQTIEHALTFLLYSIFNVFH